MSDPTPPPPGGASLECSFGYHGLSATDLADLVGCVAAFGFALETGKAALFLVDAASIPHDATWDDVAHTRDAKAVGARLKGALGGLPTDAAVVIHLVHPVVSISVPEDVLWAGVSPPHPQDDRLSDFFSICRAVAAWRRPRTFAIGSEPALPEEVTTPFTDEALSPAARHELLQWYADVYLRRW